MVAKRAINRWLEFRRGLWQLLGAVLLVLVGAGPAMAQNQVSLGRDVYTAVTPLLSQNCKSCHFTLGEYNPTDLQGSGHPQAANNLQRLIDAFKPTNGNTSMPYDGVVGLGKMTLAVGTAALNPPNSTQLNQLFQLALYIGQYKAPLFKVTQPTVDPLLAMNVLSGVTGTKDFYSRIRDDGSGGAAQDGAGLVISNTTANAAVGGVTAAQVAGNATVAYNVSYRSVAGFTGADNFRLSVVNPSGSAFQTIAVNVLGIDSGASGSGKVGQASATVYTISSNDATASAFSASVTGRPAGASPTTTLADLGLSVGGSVGCGAGRCAAIAGAIPALAVPGDYTIVVQAMINGVVNPGTASKTVTLTVAGINSATTLGPLAQNGVNQTNYNITSFPAATNGTYTLVPSAGGQLPSWISVNNGSGLVTFTPTTSGQFDFTMGATTSGVPSYTVTQNLRITVTAATAPVITTNMPASSSGAAVTVGTSVVASNYTISASTPPAIDAGSYTLVPVPPSINPGLGVNANSGAITGTPTASGIFVLRLGATNAGGTGVGTTDITVLINPNTAPVVNNIAPPDGNVGVPFTGYSVTATNVPITAYGIFAGSSMPPNLSLNTTNGAITGTPGTSGLFKTKFTATNAAGTSVPVELAFNIIAAGKPVITSPTFASYQAGVEIAPLQIVATNPVITGYRQTGLPPGLVLDTGTGQITGVPSTPGVYPVKLAAKNDFLPTADFGAEVTVQFTVGIPAPTSCAMSVPLNTATTLDLASCLFAGFLPTGVTIVATPAHGTVTVNGTKVTYTPVNNYFGSDTFTFVGSGTGGKSPQGTVTVTVTGRPDPTQDAVVAGLLTAQTDAAQRFSRAQISNFQRRMETLHRSPGAQGPVGSGLQGRIDTPASVGFGSAALAGAGVTTAAATAPATATDWLAARNNAVTPQTPGAITSLAANHAPAAARESDVVRALSAGLGVQSLPLAESVISLVKNRSINLSSVGSGLGLNASPASGSAGSVSYWVEGVATFGTRDAQGGFSSSEFSSDGITVGVDKRYSDQLALGMGLGYARDKTLIGTDGSVNRSKGYSLAVYGSYQPTPTTFIDGLLGVGSLDFNSSRFVAPISDFAYGKRNGSQVFGALTGGYEWRNGNMLLSPYGRIDFSTSRLDTSTETGAGAYALRYVRQTSTSVEGALGVRAESIHAADFGYAVPRVRVEYRHEFKRSGDAYIQYADQAGGPLYRLPSAGGPRDSMVLGLGSDFILRDGLSLSIEYQLSHSFSNASTHALRLRLSKDFDVRGLPRLLSENAEAARDEPINVQLEAGAVYDDNVTRAKTGADRLGDHSYALNVGKAIRQQLSANSRLLWTGTLGGEKFRSYNGLSRVSLTGEVEYQYRASSEFDEPTLGAFARLTGEAFESELRDGYRFSAGVSLRQPLTDRISMFAALSHNRRNASSDVFSTVDNAIRGNLDYAIDDKQIVYLGAEYRKGDIVSTGRASLENVTVADVFAQDDAYPGGQMFSYRFRGATTLLTMGYNLGLGPRDSIDFSWRHIRSTPGLRPSFVTSPRSYKANQLSVVYLMRF